MRIPLLDGGGVQPIADLNFQISRYNAGALHFGTPDGLTGWSFTRASSKTAQDSLGNVVSFASGVPAITDLGFLVEAASTNQLLQSQTLATTPWSASAATATNAATTAPDGTATGCKLAEDATTAQHYTLQNGPSVSSGVPYVASVFLKAAERSAATIWLLNASTADRAVVNVTLTGAGIVATSSAGGTPYTSISSTIQALANGWYRVTLTATTSAASTIQVRLFSNTDSSFAGTLGSGVYAWGAQLEQASAVSSHIPTTTASVTRAADAATVTYSGSPTTATVSYGTNSTATPSAASPLNLGASSGGAWVGNYIRRVVVQ